jgi:hypothetical protein
MSAAIIEAVSHSARISCSAITASSLHGADAQKCRANLFSGWIFSSTTAFGPNSTRRDAACADDRPANSDCCRLANSSNATRIRSAMARGGAVVRE